MDLIADLAKPPSKRPVARSVMDAWLDTQTIDVREAVLTAAQGDAWGHTALRDKLSAYGAPNLSTNAIRAWRKKCGWKR